MDSSLQNTEESLSCRNKRRIRDEGNWSNVFLVLALNPTTASVFPPLSCVIVRERCHLRGTVKNGLK